MTDELIGRVAELEQIAAVLGRARHGSGQLLVVRGEPGIGKSRLLDEVAAMAAAHGFRTLAGRADQFDKRVPFAVLRIALGPALRAEQNRRLVDDARRLDAVLHLAALPEAVAGGSEAFELLFRIVSEWAAVGPVLLAVDDFHSADADTVAALGFLTRHISDRVVIAIATRSHPPDLDVEMAALIEHLVASGPSCVLELSPLDIRDTSALASRELGATPSAQMAEEIWTSTRGNPFFTVELVRALRELGMVDDGHAELQLAEEAPMVVTEGATVLHRVFRLGPNARLVAQAAAVLPAVELDDLPWISDVTVQPEDATTEGFDILVGANLLQRVDGVYRFTHPIVRNTVYEDLGPAERRRLHMSVAARRLRQRDAGWPVDIVDVARHLRLAAVDHGADVSAVFVEAGDLSVGQAPRSAAAWYEDALRVMPMDSIERGDVLFRLARARLLGSNKRDAARIAREAMAILPPGRLRQRAAELCFVALQSSGAFDEALDLSAAIGDADLDTARIAAHRAQLLLWLDRIDEATVELGRAEQLAGPEADHMIDAARLNLLWVTGHAVAARALAAEIWSKLPEYRDMRRYSALVALATTAVYLGEPRAAAAALSALGEPVLLRGVVASAAVYLRVLDGRWDEALDLAARTESDLAEDDRATLPLLLSAVATVKAERGEVLDAAELRRRLLAFPTFVRWALVGAAQLDRAAGDVDGARTLLRRALDRELRVGRVATIPLTVLPLAEIEMATGHGDRAAELSAILDAHVTGDWSARGRACHHLTRALVQGNSREAATAAEVSGEHGLAFEQAQAWYLGGKLSDDVDLLVDAAEAFRALGARVRERDAVRELRRLGRSLPRAGRSDGGLTDTERQLAHLVGRGMTNREIAAAVHLSPKTVELYLTRLYAKVGCSSRVDLAVAVSSGRLAV